MEISQAQCGSVSWIKLHGEDRLILAKSSQIDLISPFSPGLVFALDQLLPDIVRTFYFP